MPPKWRETEPMIPDVQHTDDQTNRLRCHEFGAQQTPDPAPRPSGDTVTQLEGLDLEGLRHEWHRRWGSPPKLRSADLLRLMLAWRIQAEVQGGLTAKTKRQLASSNRPVTEGLELGVGAVLTREWHGEIVEVVVEADGFRWDGRTFASLSAAASAIAGTRWNGPRFFGLRDARHQRPAP